MNDVSGWQISASIIAVIFVVGLLFRSKRVRLQKPDTKIQNSHQEIFEETKVYFRNVEIIIRYQDVKDDKTERHITLKGGTTQRMNGGVLTLTTITAFCHSRNAIRKFRIDRIRRVVDAITGEVIEDSAKFFNDQLVDGKPKRTKRTPAATI